MIFIILCIFKPGILSYAIPDLDKWVNKIYL